MPMDRRSILKGMGAASLGGSAIFGSGALTQLSSARTVSVNVTNDSSSALSLSAGTAADGIGTIEESDGQLTFTLSNINADSELIIGDAPSADPSEDVIGSAAFTIDTSEVKYDDPDFATGIEVSVTPSDPNNVPDSGLGLIFLPTGSPDDLANETTTDYTGTDQNSVASAGLDAAGSDIASLPSRYDTGTNSAKFLLDNESTVGAELLLQADAADLSDDPSFDITITAEPVDAPPYLASSDISVSLTHLTSSSTSTHRFEVQNNYSDSVTADITFSNFSGKDQNDVSLSSGGTTTVDLDAAHLETISPTVDVSADSSDQSTTVNKTLTVDGPAHGGTESARIDVGGTLYDVHAFASAGDHTLSVDSAPSSGNVEALIVGGGGAGGYPASDSGSHASGGGGAGGLLYYGNGGPKQNDGPISVSAGDTETITVGDGASASISSTPNNGGESSAFGHTATGGGGGGYSDDANTINAGNDGGSAGGSGGGDIQDGQNDYYEENAVNAKVGGGKSSGTPGQGTGGGAGAWDTHGDNAGGGGGAAQAGGDFGANTANAQGAGAGGDGYDFYSVFQGVAEQYGEAPSSGSGYFAGGGGAHGTGGAGAGGLGGGAAGGGNSASANTGGGGGGSINSNTPGAGGSGIVLIRDEV